MGRMPRLVERGKKDRRLGEPREVSWEEIECPREAGGTQLTKSPVNLGRFMIPWELR